MSSLFSGDMAHQKLAPAAPKFLTILNILLENYVQIASQLEFMT
jgi:hypothetical protein